MVKFVKLINGEDFITDLRDENFSELGDILQLDLTKTCRIVQRSPEQIGITPFVPTPVTGKVNILASKIMFISNVDEQMTNEYNKLFGGIVTAQTEPPAPPKLRLVS